MIGYSDSDYPLRGIELRSDEWLQMLESPEAPPAPPALVVVIPLEATPSMHYEGIGNRADEERIGDWICANDDLRDLLRHAEDVVDSKAAKA